MARRLTGSPKDNILGTEEANGELDFESKDSPEATRPEETPVETEKKRSKTRAGSYTIEEDNHKWLVSESARKTVETGERSTASSLLNEIINKYRGKKL